MIQSLLEEDDVTYGKQGPALKERLYGAPRTSNFERSVFRQVVRQFDLDPQPRLRWLVEGDTEEGFISRYAELCHINLAHSGTEVVNLRGLGGLESNRTRTLLKLSQNEEVFSFVSIDHDKIFKNPGILQTYAQQKLLPAGYKVYHPDFEEKNFTLEELAETANRFAEMRGVDCQITSKDIQDEMTEAKLPVGKSIVRLWRRFKFYDGKGIEWGQALADIAFDHDASPDISQDDGKRPAIYIFDLLLRAQSSNYKFTVEKSYVDNEGRVIINDNS